MAYFSLSFWRAPLLAASLLLVPALPSRAQQATPPAPADTTLRKYQTPPGTPKKAWYKGKLVRASIVPAVLIGYGISVVDGHGFYSSYDAKRDIQRNFPNFNNHLDNYLQWSPYLELGGVLLAGVDSRNDRVNLALILVKSEALMLGSVYLIKTATQHERPDGSDKLSFPSGHTAQAFLAASIVHTELREKSQWYGIGAYTLATTVGAFRMLNNKHWESDVFAGAGVGILSAHLAYLSHRHRWGRHPADRGGVGLAVPKPAKADWQFSPTLMPGGGLGVFVSWRAK
ncbi:phosphatase PAP2 family protein [Hymenobacter sp. HMF4947]|uniref:Phosphatase PAP2 family protein n=1 Tax=Hymenobacter ginkgonis TaxID=2682976 RepID=A0A7K1TBL3_9BACT|nr:phosphatase PAP2 family protein [Hymenobacter ginkgonis]MVN75775.1 phosphatase PAP2 family protein [Hymenobacter ginkgonis]